MNEPDAGIATLPGAAALNRSRDTAEEMLESVYDQYAQALYRYARFLVGSTEDAEDVVQEVFIRIAREQNRVFKIRNLKAYLFSATRNVAYSQLRNRKRRDDLSEAIIWDLPVGGTGKVVGSAEALVLNEALDELPVDQREALALKVFEQMTFQEIARTVGTSINTVSSRYRYGIAKLRQALEDNQNG